MLSSAAKPTEEMQHLTGYMHGAAASYGDSSNW